MTNVVGAGQVAMHSVERRRFGRAQMGAAILYLVPLERENPAVSRNRGRERRRAIGRGNRGCQMLQTILDPLYWTPDYARRGANEDDIGEDALFDAEAAARVGWRSQPQAVAGYLQRT